MFLKSLKIECNGNVVRDIPFRKGMNLIVDETPTGESNKQKTGNNVGKTTVLRLISFCLGGDAKSLYQDPEFPDKANEEIKSFLTQKNVIITLSLQKDLEDNLSKLIVIRRNFLARKQRVLEINGEPILSKDFDAELKKVFFGFFEDKPTFKQIKAKNIRDEAERLENTVKVLGGFGRNEEYEALYLFWLGINLVDAEKKRGLLEDQKLENKILDRLQKGKSESMLRQFLAILKRDIKALKRKKDNFNLNENYERDIEKLNQVRFKLNQHSSEVSRLEFRKALIEESRDDLEKDQTHVDTSQIAYLYEQAKALIPKVQKSFEETVDFHNQMISEKIKYITQELPSLNQKLSLVKIAMKDLLAEEKAYAVKLQKAGAIEELQEIVGELNKLYEEKGSFEEKLNQFVSSNSILNGIKIDLAAIDQGIKAKDPLIQERVILFNKYFSSISNNLYGEKFALSANFEKQSKTDNYFYKLSIGSLSGRQGTGKKKGEIAAFDLAYIKFADKQGLKCLHFVLHDQMEIVHDNQISGLLEEVSNTNCQLVVSILRDKLPIELQNSEYEILSLSQDNKLFKVK
ncbi:MAG: DUF2326 domain-containing protein [Mariprofundaceae bacterium]|nr:DUF2326 domain-containing protein [Mariprofundaceae bacterium]